MATVTLVPYDDRWPGRAAAVLGHIVNALGDAVVHADHIGSTAIPAMTAKDVLDLQLSVDDLDLVVSFDGPLSELGFRRLDYRYDHVPGGRTDPADLWSKRFYSRRGHEGGDVNLHVRRVGSPNERLALLFRDWLRAHPEAVPAYAAFKSKLAGAVDGLQTYTDVKDPVVDLVASVAEAWADEVGWRPHAGAPQPAD